MSLSPKLCSAEKKQWRTPSLVYQTIQFVAHDRYQFYGAIHDKLVVNQLARVKIIFEVDLARASFAALSA
jgi:hypothetical protein